MLKYIIILLGLLSFNIVEAQTRLEMGPAILSEELSDGISVLLVERFSGKYDIGIGFIGEQFVDTCGRIDCQFDIRENIFIFGQRIFKYKKVEFGIGFALFQNTNRALGCKGTLPLMLAYRLSDRFYLLYRHFSNAGSCVPNLGQDMALLSYNFGK